MRIQTVNLSEENADFPTNRISVLVAPPTTCKWASEPLEFYVDTGGTGTFVSEQQLKQLGIQYTVESTDESLQTIAGPTKARVARIDLLVPTPGVSTQLAFTNVAVRLGTEENSPNILGQNVLQYFDLVFQGGILKATLPR